MIGWRSHCSRGALGSGGRLGGRRRPGLTDSRLLSLASVMTLHSDVSCLTLGKISL